MVIRLGIGVGNIKFGMKKEGIESIYGKPDEIRIDDDYEDEELLHQFNSFNTRVTYYNNEGLRLGYIRSSNKDLLFNGKKIIDLPISELEKTFGNLIFEEEVFDFWVDYFNEENWLLIRCEYGKIKEIEIGVPFVKGSEEEYDWPK